MSELQRGRGRKLIIPKVSARQGDVLIGSGDEFVNEGIIRFLTLHRKAEE